MNNRRKIIVAFGAGALAAPFGSFAQPQGKVWRLPSGIRGDERKFKQIMLNLLSNAVKFTPEGGRITVAARSLDAGVEISVTDTGIGIATGDLDAVFEEFRQVGTDYTKKSEGTGLGLALTRKFVELHGGTIRCSSEPGKGSTFTFTLPLEPVAATPAAASNN